MAECDLGRRSESSKRTNLASLLRGRPLSCVPCTLVDPSSRLATRSVSPARTRDRSLDAILEKPIDSALATGPRQRWATGFVPLHALTDTSVPSGAFCCLWEFRVFSTNLNILRSICSDHGDRCATGQRRRPRRFTAVLPTPHAYSGQSPLKTKPARARSCRPRLSPGNARH